MKLRYLKSIIKEEISYLKKQKAQQLNEYAWLLPIGKAIGLGILDGFAVIASINYCCEMGWGCCVENVRPNNVHELDDETLRMAIEMSGNSELQGQLAKWDDMAQSGERGIWPPDTRPQLPTIREAVNATFKNNMENLYASKGCTGLKKKLGQLNNKLSKVQTRTGAGAGNWSDQVKARVTHLDSMMQNLGCNTPGPSIA
jgi:hypothetical protein